MSKRICIRIMLLLGVASCGMITAFTEFRSPLSLYRGPTYWPQPAQDDGKWVIETWDAIYHRAADEAYIPKNICACPAETCSAACCNRTSATLWDCSARPCAKGCGCKNGSSTRHTEQLSTLFFGKSLFRVEEAFAGGMLSVPQMQAAGIPAISFSRLAPALQYSERGFIAGIHAHRKLGSDGMWRIGTRVELPFKVINTERTCGGDCKSAETIDDVMALGVYLPCSSDATSSANLRGVPTFAYRLDFLSSLLFPASGSCGDQSQPLVVYGNGENVYDPVTGEFVQDNNVQNVGPTRIAGIDVGPYKKKDASLPAKFIPDFQNRPPVFAKASLNGCIPSQPFVVLDPPQQTPPQVYSFLTNDGNFSKVLGGAQTALVQDGVYNFISLKGEDLTPATPGIGNYATGLGLDRDAQSQLWIVPEINTAGQLSQDAQQINQVVQVILNTMDFTGKQSSDYFLNSKCIFLKDRHVTGVGDLDTEVYAGYHGEDKSPWYTDFILGVRYPTGRKLTDPGQLLFVPTGNNGHFEVKGAVEGGWNPNKWFAMRALLEGVHVCSRTEKRAVPFLGAKIRNIGPTMDVDVSYNYFWGNLDFTFFHPEHKNFGCSIGYELWARSDDKLSCCRTPCGGDSGCGKCAMQAATIRGGKANDLLGFNNLIDCSIYKCGSATMTHKLRGELFHRCEGGYFELFGGGYYVVGGRYAMKESEVHLGVAVNF